MLFSRLLRADHIKMTDKSDNSITEKTAPSAYLAWMDIEMSGLDPETDTILEIATIITDHDLEVVSEGPVIVVHQHDEVLDSMDDWNKEHHGASGLIERVRQSTTQMKDAELMTLDFVKGYIAPKESPLCGNSIWQDRRFLVKYMPELEAYFHYRNIDVSSIKELCARWYPDLPRFKKKNTHTALSDIRESIAELKYYRNKIFIK